MVQLTFYGCVLEIGGNKILLEDGDKKLFLDFGFPYKRHKLFYEEYLKPRSGAGLLDPLVMGLVPPLEGIYRKELEEEVPWENFLQNPSYRKLDHLDGVLLSHAHLDHSGHISFLREDIPIYTTALTAFISKTIQDSGKTDFDQQACYFNPVVWKLPNYWKQEAFITQKGSKKQRPFCIDDQELKNLNQEAIDFWEKIPGQTKLVSCPLSSHSNCSFPIRSFPVDHSILGASAWGVETSSGWIVYSGDLRLHGKRSLLTKNFIEEACKLQPRILILEGTNIPKEKNTSEQEVKDNALKAIQACQGLVIADFAARDVDRLLTFLEIAKETKRQLVILPKDAYLLKTVRLLDSTIPDLSQETNLFIYEETLATKNPENWLRNTVKDYEDKTVLARDVRSNQGSFILAFSFFDLNELPSIYPKEGSLYLYSSSEPHDEEQEIDFRRLRNWLKHFGLHPFGLPQEENGSWEIPEDQRGLHASGHACFPDLLEIARRIKPEILIPVHSEHPEYYKEHLKGSGIDVRCPEEIGSSLVI